MDLSLREAAKILDVSESTLSRWVNDEGLAAYQINGRYRFNRVDLLEWASRRKLAAPALFAAPGGSEPELASLLEGNIHYRVPGADLRSALAAVAERLPLPSARDKAVVAEVLSAREALGTTAVGDGIAIPHARSPLVFGVDRPLLSLSFLAKPVAPAAEGAEPLHTLFVLVTPTVRGHLLLLSKLALALHDEAFRALLRERAEAPRLLDRLRELA